MVQYWNADQSTFQEVLFSYNYVRRDEKHADGQPLH